MLHPLTSATSRIPEHKISLSQPHQRVNLHLVFHWDGGGVHLYLGRGSRQSWNSSLYKPSFNHLVFRATPIQYLQFPSGVLHGCWFGSCYLPEGTSVSAFSSLLSYLSSPIPFPSSKILLTSLICCGLFTCSLCPCRFVSFFKSPPTPSFNLLRFWKNTETNKYD